ncbi:MAG: LutC/YkgG family protein [Nocardioidaceae bacterium]
MTSAREEILARVRRANDAAADRVEIVRAYERSSGALPGAPEVLDLLEQRLVDYRATVHRDSDVPAAVRSALGSATSVVVPPGLEPSWVPGALVDDGTLTARELDSVDAVVTAATVACARTGTVVLDGSRDQGRRVVSLVPDLHVCVVRADQVVDSVPEMIERLDPLLPLTFISGPSATSDIELERVEGVHGPRNLHIVLAPPPR